MAARQMRIAVMGTGAVGGYFGARLAAMGQNVAFIARGSHLEAMRKEGLKVKSVQGDLHVRALFTSDPSEVGLVDVVLFCVKSYDTEDAAADLAPMIGEKTVILSLQNGVDNPDKIAARWGKARTLAGVVYLGAFVSQPGVIEHSAGGRIVLGDMGGEASEPAKRVEQILSGAQIPCAVSAEIRNVMLTKLVWNAPFCALACLARDGPGNHRVGTSAPACRGVHGRGQRSGAVYGHRAGAVGGRGDLQILPGAGRLQAVDAARPGSRQAAGI